MNPFESKTEGKPEKNTEQEKLMSTTPSKPEIPKPPIQQIGDKIENHEMVANESKLALFNTSVVKSVEVASAEKSDVLISSSSSFLPDNLTVTYRYYFSLCF